MLNFGAFIAFMGVNAAAFVHYFLRAERKRCGRCFGRCSALEFAATSSAAQYAGKKTCAVWVAVGLIYGAWKTSGFRKTMSFEAPAE